MPMWYLWCSQGKIVQFSQIDARRLKWKKYGANTVFRISFMQNFCKISKIYFKLIQEVSDYFTEDWLCQIPDSFETSEGVGWERINQFQSLQSKYEPVSYPSICSGKIQKSKNRGLKIKDTL